MDKGFDPYNDELLTVLEYEGRYDKAVSSANKPADRPDARCPACLGKLYVKGINNKTALIFAHKPSPEACPIKEVGKEKYEVLSPVGYDDNIAIRLRASFFKNWKLHWLQFMKYVNYVDVDNFIALLKYADKTQLWRYRGLQEYEVTFILLVLMHFKPVANYSTKAVLRAEWVSFWFPATVRQLDDFWNLQPTRRILVKALYSTSAKSKLPNAKHLTELDVVKINNGYLVGRDPEAAKVAQPVINKMVKAFSKELKVISDQ